MTTVVDPDNLTVGTDIIFDTTALTIQLVSGTGITNAGSTGGVTLQCVYSKCKEQWKSSSTLVKFNFPLTAITPESFEIGGGWTWYDDTTRNLIRNAGWAEKNGSGTTTRSYMGVISLGTIGSSDQPYLNWGGGAKVVLPFAGAANSAVQIYGDSSNGSFDHTGSTPNFVLYVREQGKTYAQASNTDIGAATLTYQVYRFPLSNATDLNITDIDSAMSGAPYSSITAQWYTSDQSRDTGTGAANYRIIVTDASGVATLQEIYTKVQYLLRQNSDIDTGSGTQTGSVTAALMAFTGPQLITTTSVAIDSINSNYVNFVTFTDKTGATHTYPFISAGTINFGSNAVSGDLVYRMMFASGFPGSSAVTVNDNSGTPIAGTFSGSSVTFTFAYDSNTQGGRTAGTDAPVKLVGIGTTGAQYVEVDFTITRAAGQIINLTPALERVYVNP